MALVLTRYPHQGIIIGEDIKVTIVGVTGNQVKIAIDAPRDVNIRRDELEPLQPKDYTEQNNS